MLTKKNGQSLVELLIAIGVASLVLPALYWGLTVSSQTKAQEKQALSASALVTEAEEAVRSSREANWSNVATNGVYHPVVVSGAWSLATGSEIINSYTRTVTISDASRDASGNLVSSGGTVDPSTKKVVVNVAWTTPSTSNVNSTFYLTRYINNVGVVQPASVNFSTYSLATSNNVTVNSSNVTLAPAGPGRGDWCTTAATPVSSLNLTGNSLAHKLWAIPGTAFAGTGTNSSGLPLANISITNPAAPANPVASTAWTFNPGGTTATTDIFGDSNFSYIATNSNTEEVMVVSNSTHAKVSSFNTTGSTDPTSVFVLNNIGYVTSGSSLFTFNMSPPVSGTSRAISATVSLASTATSVKVIQVSQGTFAFVTNSGTTNQLQIFKVNSLTSLTLVGQATVAGQGGVDVAISADGTRAYLVTASSASQREFFVIDSTPALTASSVTTLSTLSSYDTNGMNPLSVALAMNDLRAIIVGSGAGVHQYQVVDLRASPLTECGYINASTNNNNIYDVAPIVEGDGDAWAYILTGNTSSDFQIINGGPGGQYASSGTYESTTFDAGTNVVFNRILMTFDQPAATQTRFQIAVKSSSGSCSGVTFNSSDYIGPNNDPALYFTSSGTGTQTLNIPVPTITTSSFQNPGRCLRYRVLFTPSTNFLATPNLTNVQLNYTP